MGSKGGHLIYKGLFIALGVLGLLGAAAPVSLNFVYDRATGTFAVYPPEAIPDPVGHYYASGQIGAPVPYGVPPLESTDLSSDFSSIYGQDASAMSVNGQFLNILSAQLGSSIAGYSVKCIKGLHVMRAANGLPMGDSTDVQYVQFALYADSVVLARSQTSSSNEDFSISVNNFKNILESAGKSLFGVGNSPSIASTPSTPMPSTVTCDYADSVIADLKKELNTPTPSQSPNPSSSATASPSPSPSTSPSTTPSATPSISPTPSPSPTASTSPAPSTSPGVAFGLTSNGSWAVVTYDTAHSVIIAVGVIETVPVGTPTKTNFEYQDSDNSSVNASAQSQKGEYTLSFAYQPLEGGDYCVRVDLERGIEVGHFNYCPRRFLVDERGFNGPYVAPQGMDTRQQVAFGNPVDTHDPKGLSTDYVQTIVDVGQLAFHFRHDPATGQLGLYAVKGGAQAVDGTWRVTRSTKP